jgi:hypothetical protein
MPSPAGLSDALEPIRGNQRSAQCDPQSNLKSAFSHTVRFAKNANRVISTEIAIPPATSRTIEITGCTNSIPDDYHEVLAMDLDRVRLCWPKKPFIEPNIAFEVEIDEDGLAGECSM